ncbi:MAG: PAS domain S-box protein, partial [Rhodospirillaceae bacterium]
MSNDHLHHKSERSLQVHLAHAQAAFDAITDALIAIDENGTIENANIAAVRIFGYTNEELFGENVSILMPEPDRSHHDEYIANYLRSGKPKVIGIGRELVGQKKDGSLFPMELSVGEAVVGDHKVFTGIVRDITSQRAAESKRDLYGRLVEQSLNEIYTFEVDTLFFTQINEGARRNLGYSLDELKSMTPLDVKSDFTEQSFRSLIAPIVEKEKEKIVFETRHKRKDGSLYDVEVHMQRLENGAKTLIAAFIVDVTERNQIVKQLKAAYSFSSTLLESAAVLIAASDAHQRFTSFNRAAEQLTGYTEAEVLGRNPRDFLIPPEDLEKYDQLVSVGLRKAQSAQNLRPTGGPDTFDWLCKDGSRRTISWWYGSAPDEESTERYWIIATGIDVTGVKALEDQLRQAQKMETLGHLTGGIAHDFNNLLAAIMGSLEIVESEISDQTPIKEFLNDALEATEMAADLTRRLLTFARRQPLEPKITDLNALIRNVQGILRRTLGGNIIMELRLKKDIGLTTVDPVQFENLIMNLCIYARDAMPTGGTLTI